jgi:sialic acid synthase SpsE
VGLSDHTLGTAVAVAAVALGASIIEKHVTLDHELATVDGEFSLDPAGLAQLVRDTHSAWSALGEVGYGPTDSEVGSLRFRRGLYFVRDLAPERASARRTCGPCGRPLRSGLTRPRRSSGAHSCAMCNEGTK